MEGERGSESERGREKVRKRTRREKKAGDNLLTRDGQTVILVQSVLFAINK